MITAVLLGILVGFVLAIPPGPIGMAAIRMAIDEGWRSTLRLAFGASLFDVAYCTLAMIATSAVVRLLQKFETTSPLATIGFQLAIVVVMIIFGIVQMRARPKKPRVKPIGKRATTFIEWIKGHGPFFVGAGFALANLANPTFVPSLAALSTFIQKLDLFEDSMVTDALFAVGFGAGNFLWLVVIAHLVISNREKMTPTFIKRIQQLSGATLIGFGTFYGVRILVITKWADVARIIFAA